MTSIVWRRARPRPRAASPRRPAGCRRSRTTPRLTRSQRSTRRLRASPATVRMPHREHGEAATDSHQRRLRSNHCTQHQAGRRRQHDARQVTCGRRAGAEPSAGRDRRVLEAGTTSPTRRRLRSASRSATSRYMVVPEVVGIVCQTTCSSSCTAARKPKAMTESGMPKRAANNNKQEIAAVVQHHTDLGLGRWLAGVLSGSRMLGAHPVHPTARSRPGFAHRG